MIDPQCLVDYLKRKVSCKELKNSLAKQEKGYTSYKFKIYNNNGELNNYLVVKVKNSERYLHKQTIDQIKETTKFSTLITKCNILKTTAIISIGIVIMGPLTPILAKGLSKLDQKDYEYDQQRYHKYLNYSNTPIVTDEQKQEAVEDYYIDLEKKAKAGDKEAIREYSQYIIEQQLKEQAQEERSNVR